MTSHNFGVKLTPLPLCHISPQTSEPFQNDVACLRLPSRHKVVIIAYIINWTKTFFKLHSFNGAKCLVFNEMVFALQPIGLDSSLASVQQAAMHCNHLVSWLILQTSSRRHPNVTTRNPPHPYVTYRYTSRKPLPFECDVIYRRPLSS